ncbi:Gp19/Gp15/Gp42 family protein [Actinophytocola sp.]|uniref:Gp19/Gp15/Gp42 family protein n=1 Tax=Actinophytocola sp. TaxID=1872138 RepID=UPI003D6B7672
MSYASVADVEVRLGRPLTDAERDLAAVLLEDAETVIRVKIPDLDQRIADGRLRRELVVMVEANAVVRVLRNPGGFRSETAGDYSYTLDTRAAAGYLTIPDADWYLLGVRPGAFTIRPAFPRCTIPPPPTCPHFCPADCWCVWSPS